ncbi:MAG TPA: hypothetical protein VHE33_06330 [Acidobacteriaceae bacterium]|nr:hypothetical protein [Acidobacteriaceae bacterium]
MAAKAEAACSGAGGVEPGPAADAGRTPIGTDDPTGMNPAGSGRTDEAGRLAGAEDDRRMEGEAHAEGGGSVAKKLVEGGATHAQASEIGEIGRDTRVGIDERDSGEGEALEIGEHAESSEGAPSVRHKTFAARFIDGSLAGVGDEDIGSTETECDSGR